MLRDPEKPKRTTKFAQLLKERRIQKGLSVAELSEKVNLSRYYVYLLESEESTCTDIFKLAQFSKALDIPILEVINALLYDFDNVQQIDIQKNEFQKAIEEIVSLFIDSPELDIADYDILISIIANYSKTLKSSY
jgi:transcriptional regulator with XRE-family HTH domain